MSSTLTLADSVTSGLTYFAWAGTAAIARQLTNKRVEMRWSHDPEPKAELSFDDLSVEDIATEVKRLATVWATGWTAATARYSSGTFSPFSPRFKAIDPKKHPEDWVLHQRIRFAELDLLEKQDDRLALDLIQALGEAAYWRFENHSPRPDHGASRWEMKTRNRGEEFIRNRFHPMCIEIGNWTVPQIIRGLTGEVLNDTLAKGKEDSRTSTGLTPPRPADAALAFVALIGISAFPVLHRLTQISVTPGAYPNHVLHPTSAVFPLPVLSITPERLENIILSKNWANIVAELGPETPPADPAGDHELARQQGVPAAVLYGIRHAGSSSAPERYFEEGKVVLLS